MDSFTVNSQVVVIEKDTNGVIINVVDDDLFEVKTEDNQIALFDAVELSLETKTE